MEGVGPRRGVVALPDDDGGQVGLGDGGDQRRDGVVKAGRRFTRRTNLGADRSGRRLIHDGQGWRGEAEEGLTQRHVDMHGAGLRSAQAVQGSVEQGADVLKGRRPALGIGVAGQRAAGGIGQQGVGLHQRLAVQLAYPFGGAVGGDDEQGQAAHGGLGHTGEGTEQGGAGGDAEGHGGAAGQDEAEGHEGGTALVGHGMDGQGGVGRGGEGIKIVHQHAVARAGAHHHVTHAIGGQHGC